VNATSRASAGSLRSLLASTRASPAVFRAALASVLPADRDAWLDLVFGLDGAPEDGPELPRGCVPYLPCSVETLLQIAEHAGVQASDVFVDIGSGVGRAAALMQLVTGAAAIGIEIQPALVRASRALATRLHGARLSVIQGDAALLTGFIMVGSVFFLYCPFSGDRLESILADLEVVARTRPIRICCVDLPLPARPWLTLVSTPSAPLAIYRSTSLDAPGDQPRASPRSFIAGGAGGRPSSVRSSLR
jgi:SAM-dependent methyltransferase